MKDLLEGLDFENTPSIELHKKWAELHKEQKRIEWTFRKMMLDATRDIRAAKEFLSLYFQANGWKLTE